MIPRTQDTANYALVWLMLREVGKSTAAYRAVAHGITPWWTEAYVCQEKGNRPIPIGTWFWAGLEV